MNNRLAKILAAIIARTFAEDISDKITFGAAWTAQTVRAISSSSTDSIRLHRMYNMNTGIYAKNN